MPAPLAFTVVVLAYPRGPPVHKAKRIDQYIQGVSGIHKLSDRAPERGSQQELKNESCTCTANALTK